MKKALVTIILTTMLILPAGVGALETTTPVQASSSARPNQSDSGVGSSASSSARLERIQNLRDAITARREEMQLQKEAHQEEIQNKLSERKRVRIRNLYQLMRRRISAAITRLTNIAGRIETRLTILADEGQDVTEAMTLLNEAKAKLTFAESSLATIDSAIENVVASEEPLKEFQDVRELIQELHLLLVDVRQLLWGAVQSVKIPTGEVAREASSAADN